MARRVEPERPGTGGTPVAVLAGRRRARNSVPVGELTPLRRRRFVPADVLLAAFAGVPAIDADRFRGDLDRSIDQSTDPGA